MRLPVRWLIAVLALAGLHGAAMAESYPVALANPVSRQLRFNLTVSNPTSRTLVDQVIWLYGPVKRTATQQLQKLESSIAYQLEEDALGNQIIVIKLDRLAPFATKIVNIKADVLLAAQPAPSQLGQTDVYLADEPYIEKDDAAVQAAAAALKAADAGATAARIYEWVRSNMRYAGYIAEDLGARFALANRRGDCTEYADLATALARANNIPARTLGGFVMDRNGAPSADSYHNWSELHIDGRWNLLDAQKENFRSKSEWYIATRIISSAVKNAMQGYHRFRVQGEIVVRLN